jgi:PHD/YefM family antitoxin component YafN of YafNO toxin-antitoxin module
MSDDCFQTLDISGLQSALAHVHERVSGRHGRVEVTREDCDDVCVMVSKAELQSLEQALEILAESETFKSMSEQIARVAAECSGCELQAVGK